MVKALNKKYRFPYRYGLYQTKGYEFSLALRNYIYRCDIEAGYRALKNNDYEIAKKIFSGPYLSETNIKLIDNWRQSNGKTESHKWTSTQYYGKTLAHIGLKQWDEALK